MASYEKQSGKWSVRFRYEDKNKRLSGYDTKKEAEQAYRLFMLKAEDDTKAKDITVSELYELYKAYKITRVKESSFLTIKNSLDKYLPTLLEYKITEVTPQIIIKWQDMINENDFSYNFKSKLHTTLFNLFNFAVEYYGLPANPLSKVKNFKNLEQKKQMLIWTETEFEKFINAVDRYDYRVFFSLMYLTGCRKGEALALTWEDVDFDEPSIKISKTYTRATESAPYKITSAKTKGSNRTVVIPDVLLRLLKGHYSQQSEKLTAARAVLFSAALSRFRQQNWTERKRSIARGQKLSKSAFTISGTVTQVF